MDRTNYEREELQQSIVIMDSVLTSPQLAQPLSGIIVDDDIALEDSEYVILELVVTAQSNCTHVSPYNTTTIIVTDDDGKSALIFWK